MILASILDVATVKPAVEVADIFRLHFDEYLQHHHCTPEEFAAANVADSVPALLRFWYGVDAEQIDFSHYEQPGHERDPVYDIARIRAELGFVPEMDIL